MKKYSDKKFKIASFIATFMNVGRIKKAPGTFGSLATFPLWLIVNSVIFSFNLKNFSYLPIIYLAVFGVITYLGFWSTKIYIETTKKEDPSEVVIDEVAGQFLAFAIPTFFTLFYCGNFLNHTVDQGALILIITSIMILPIIFFRLFDICKFGLVKYFDTKVKGEMGIMMDDIVAGAQAGIVVSILTYFLFI